MNANHLWWSADMAECHLRGANGPAETRKLGPDGRPIKIVSTVDEHTRECLVRVVERSITGEDPTAEFDRLCR